MSKLFPVNGSVADIVTLTKNGDKLSLSNRRRITKSKNGPTLADGSPAFPMKDGNPLIGANVYRIPTKAELKEQGVPHNVLKADALLLPHLIPLGTIGTPLLVSAA